MTRSILLLLLLRIRLVLPLLLLKLQPLYGLRDVVQLIFQISEAGSLLHCTLAELTHAASASCRRQSC